MKLFNKQFSRHIIFWSILVIILLSAAFFRLTHMDVIEFKDDEAVNLYLAARPFFGYGFAPGSTVSSFNILNPPLINYLLFPFVAISFDPKVVSFCVALINVLAVMLFFLILRKYYGMRIASLSALLLAFSPWAILFSRKIWAQDFLIFFSVLLFLAVHKMMIDKDKRFQTLYIISSLFLIQLHQASIFFIGLLTIFLLIKRPSLSLKYILIGICLGSLPFFPFVRYELLNHCPDCTPLFTASSRTSSLYSPDIFFLPFQIIGKGEFNNIIGPDMVGFAAEHPVIYSSQKIFYLLYVLLLFGMLITWKKYTTLKPFVYATILLPFLYFILKIPPFIHYFVIILPLLFLYIAIAFNFGTRQKNIVLKYSAFSIFALLILTAISFNYAFYDYLIKHGGYSGDYGSIFKTKEAETKVKLAPYQKLPDYNELLLFSYIPHTQFYGGSPIAIMLFNNSITKAHLSAIEKEAAKKRYDLRPYYQLLAFYTTPPISKTTVRYLRAKQSSDPIFKKLYDETYMLYLHNNLKKSYISSLYHFLIEYPEHWQLHEDKTLQLEDDEMIADLYPLERSKEDAHTGITGMKDSLNGLTVTAFICMKQSLWCGSSYETIVINNKPYGLDIFPKDQKISYPSEQYEMLKKDLGEVVQSIEIL